MADQISDATKQAFKDASARRKANGIRLERIFIKAESQDVEWFYLFWERWVARWGKKDAMECLVYVMAEAEKAMQQHEKKKPKMKRVSAPREREPRQKLVNI